MIVGIPKGLLYYKYYPFAHSFFEELGIEIITSDETNKKIVDLGIKYCVDESCLPVKIFHGHVAQIKDKCDVLVVPRIMKEKDGEFICPKFCGLPEMIVNSIPNMPKITYEPIYINSTNKLKSWMYKTGKLFTNDRKSIEAAFRYAYAKQTEHVNSIKHLGKDITILLVGHPYIIYDDYLNMNIVKKLKSMGVGIITEEAVNDIDINNQLKNLYKKPFWTFAKNLYGACSHLANNNRIDGIVYISSFSCGIDSVVVELIKDTVKDFPFLILKIDEHTGEAGFNTRLEAFIDMLKRRVMNETYISTHGQHVYSCENTI